jgi:hypothetical protein
MSIEQEVSEALLALGIEETRLSHDAVVTLSAGVLRRYGLKTGSGSSPGRFLWERLDPEYTCSCYRPDAWRDLAAFPVAGPLLVWTERQSGWRLPDADAVSRLLGEAAPFEVIVCDSLADSVVILNHHDYLIGMGGALDWVRQLCAGCT